MSDALAHRGPDEAGLFEDDTVALAIRRLSIIDVAEGHQPYANETETVHAVFNGEIYGFQELRQRLHRRGHRLRSGTDGEVIVHAYEEHGLDFVTQLDGMFALAVWDAEAKRLILARDRVGKKPLFIAERGDGLSFASELGALLLDDRIEREVDEVALAEYLQYGYVPSPRTILRDVRKLEPGTMATWTPSEGLRASPYWTLDFEPKHQISYGDALEEFESRARESVRKRLISDVPLGLFLSGGVDSSYVLAQMIAAGAPDVQTFAIGFPDDRYDERSHAREIAERLGSTHHEAVVNPTDLVELVPSLVRHYGEPFADGSAVPTFYIARWAKQRITVALTGEGGDELFGGYYRHQAARFAALADRLPPAVRRLAGTGAGYIASEAADPTSFRQRLWRFLRAVELEPGERFAEWTAVLSPAERAAIIPSLAPAPSFEPRGRVDDPLDRALSIDMARGLADQLLVKMDIATMASSLEARAPLLDYELVEWVARLPASYKQRGLRRKRLLSDALARHIPAEMFKRRKMGFTAPISAWLRGDLYEFTCDTLLGPASRQRGLVDTVSVERLIREHRAGVDHTRGLWALLMLELWHEQFIDRNLAASVASPSIV